MKILAIDYGTKRTGLAACDEMQITTRLLPVLQTKTTGELLQKISELVLEGTFLRVLWGLPLNRDGSEGSAAKASRKVARAMGEKLRKAGWEGEIQFWDERLTSFAAEEKLREKGIPKKKGKKLLDSLSAQVLLEDYLSSLG